MKKVLLFLVIIAFVSCKEGKKQEEGTVENIKSYDKIDSYFFNNKKGWELSNAYTFNIPKNGSKLMSIYGGFGINKGETIEYYFLTMNDKGWERIPSYDFNIPNKNKVIPVFGGLAIKNKNNLEYFTLNDKSGWKRSPEYDIHLPSSSTEYLTMFGGYAIKKGNQLEYYSLQQNNKGWKRSPEYDFTIPSGKNFISFHEHIFFGGLGVINEDNLEFYTIGKNGWKRVNEMDFDLTGLNKNEIISISGGIGVLKSNSNFQQNTNTSDSKLKQQKDIIFVQKLKDKSFVIEVTNLRVRNNPSLSGEKIDVMNPGDHYFLSGNRSKNKTTVEIKGERISEYWYETYLENGNTGWVHGCCISF